MAVFSARFAGELPELLSKMYSCGYAHTDDIVDPEFLGLWQAEALDSRYAPFREPWGAGIADCLAKSCYHPRTRDGRNELIELLRKAGGRRLGRWRGDSFGLMCYGPQCQGIAAHQDDDRAVGLVVMVTLLGEATFSVHDPVELRVVTDRWRAKPGGITMMWSTPLDDPQRARGDLRPMHSVSGPLGGRHRYAACFRQY